MKIIGEKLGEKLKKQLDQTTILESFKIYGHFWKRTFDWHGVTDRWHFWVESIMTIFVFGFLYTLSETVVDQIFNFPSNFKVPESMHDIIESIPLLIVDIFEFIVLLPELAAVIRRARDVKLKLPVIWGIVGFFFAPVLIFIGLLPKNYKWGEKLFK